LKRLTGKFLSNKQNCLEIKFSSLQNFKELKFGNLALDMFWSFKISFNEPKTIADKWLLKKITITNQERSCLLVLFEYLKVMQKSKEIDQK
jgi:hypothetical protein